MEKITAGDILGSVRTALKAYQSFEHLVKVVAFLEQKEAYEDSLEKSIRNLEIEKAELGEAIAGDSASLDAIVAEIKAAQDTLAKLTKERAAMHDHIVSTAEKEARGLVDKAKAQVDSLTAEAGALRAEIKALENVKHQEQSAIDDLRTKYNQEKARILESLK